MAVAIGPEYTSADPKTRGGAQGGNPRGAGARKRARREAPPSQRARGRRADQARREGEERESQEPRGASAPKGGRERGAPTRGKQDNKLETARTPVTYPTLKPTHLIAHTFTSSK